MKEMCKKKIKICYKINDKDVARKKMINARYRAHEIMLLFCNKKTNKNTGSVFLTTTSTTTTTTTITSTGFFWLNLLNIFKFYKLVIISFINK